MPRLAKRKPVVTLEPVGHARLDDYVHRVGFSADGTKLAACAASGEVGVWDVSSFKRGSLLAGHRQSAQVLAWHPTRLELATGGQDGVVRIWDPATGTAQAAMELGGQGAWVENLGWSPDGKLLAASAGKRLRLWDCAALKEPQLAGEVPAHQTTISALAWMPRGAGILSACYGGAWLWKLGSEKPVRPFPYDGALLSIAVFRDKGWG